MAKLLIEKDPDKYKFLINNVEDLPISKICYLSEFYEEDNVKTINKNFRYSIIKMNINKFLVETEAKKLVIFNNKLMDAIKRLNFLNFQMYNFARLYILHKYPEYCDPSISPNNISENNPDNKLEKYDLKIFFENFYRPSTNNFELPDLKSFISMCYKVLTIRNPLAPKFSPENQKIYDDLNNFFELINKEMLLGSFTKVSGLNLSGAINYLIVDAVTNIENNIKMHFNKYIFKYIKMYFKNTKLWDEVPSKNRDKLIKENISEINKIFKFILKYPVLNNENMAKPIYIKYKNWINKHKPLILPNLYTIETKYAYTNDIKQNPKKYIKYMIYMCCNFENHGIKSYQFFPLKTSIIYTHIPIDTKSLVEIFETENKDNAYNNITNSADSLWKKYFKIDKVSSGMKKYKFDNMITTNGYEVSIRFIHRDDYIKNELDKKKMSKGLKDLNGMTKEQKIKIKYKKNEEHEKKKMEDKKFLEEKRIKKSEENKIEKKIIMKLPKNEREEILSKIKKEKEKIKEEDIKTKEEKRINSREFRYITELSEKELNLLELSNLMGVSDPGKRTLLFLMTINGNTLTYSSNERLVEIRTNEYLEEISEFKKSNKDVVKIEESLSTHNKNSCDYECFKNYVHDKIITYEVLEKHYSQKIFGKFKWYKYLNKNRSEKKLVERIFDLFRMELPENERQTITYKDITLIIGDWGKGQQMKNFRPTPMIGLKRMLAKYFNILLIDEYKTSKLTMITENGKIKWVENKNVYVEDRPKKTEEQKFIKIEKAKKSKKKIRETKKKKKKEDKEQNKNNKQIAKERMKNKIEINANNKKKVKKKKPDKGKEKKEKKTEKRRELHAVLIYKISESKYGYINRDRSSVKNMVCLVKHFLKERKWLEPFIRKKKEIKSEEKKKKTLPTQQSVKPKLQRRKVESSELNTDHTKVDLDGIHN